MWLEKTAHGQEKRTDKISRGCFSICHFLRQPVLAPPSQGSFLLVYDIISLLKIQWEQGNKRAKERKRERKKEKRKRERETERDRESIKGRKKEK